MDNGNRNERAAAHKQSEICAHLRLAFGQRRDEAVLPDRLAGLLRAIAARHRSPDDQTTGDDNG